LEQVFITDYYERNALPAPAILEVSDISYHYGQVKALDALSFSANHGEFVVLLGPNGAGKTTLFSLITGLYHSREGQISVCGYAMHKHPSKALLQIGVVFQQRSLDVDLSVRQNLKYSAHLYGLSPQQGMEAIEEELKRIEMIDYMDTKVRHLSGGQARRVEIARALINRPKLLVLDEPTVGLDAQSRQLILKHVRQMCSEGLSVLWTTHLLDEIHRSDSILILKKGKLVMSGSAESLTGTSEAAALREKLTALL